MEKGNVQTQNTKPPEDYYEATRETGTRNLNDNRTWSPQISPNFL